MDVHSYVLDQDVPHWAKGVPLIQVVTPAPPDMNTFLDSPLLHSFLPFYNSGFLPIDAMVKNFRVNCISILHVLLFYCSSVFPDPHLQWSPCLSNVHFTAFPTWYSVHNPPCPWFSVGPSLLLECSSNCSSGGKRAVVHTFCKSYLFSLMCPSHKVGNKVCSFLVALLVFPPCPAALLHLSWASSSMLC